jgi:uracil-DNA glycosylase
VHDDPATELRELVSALRVHVERCAATGASGLQAAIRDGSTNRPISPAGSPSGRLDRPSIDVRGAEHRPGAHPSPVIPSSAAPAQGFGPSPEAKRRLDILAKEISTCTRCRLHEERTQTVFARGTGASGLVFVGEGPGADEDAQGYPFVGKAGQLLDRMIEAMGFARDDVYVCNIVKCRPPKNRKPEPDEMATCRPYLAEQLELLAPSVIVALGATAVEGLLGIGGGITRLRGKWRLYQGRIAVMPTFHPAYLLRTPEAKRDVWQDLQEVLHHMGRPVPGKK